MSEVRVVLVPVANPNTAAALLDLALTFATAEKSRVIALYVLLGNLDLEAKSVDSLEPIIEELKAAENPIEFQTRKATNLARGILDAAREDDVDLIILGLTQHIRGHVVLGTVAENVLVTAPCNVLIYRASHHLAENPSRILVAVDGTRPSQAASQIGLSLAQHYAINLVAIYAQESYYPRWVGLGRIEESLEGIEHDARIQRVLVTASDPAAGIVARLEDHDLLVIGYALPTLFERWLFGDFSRRMLDEAPCPVILTVTTAHGGILWRPLKRFYFRLTPAEQDDIQRQAYMLAAANLDYLVLIGIASMLASFGLLANSAAVVIGAMLVAPFMQPCIAFAIGLTTRRWAVMRQALIALIVGVPVAVAVSIFSGVLVATRSPTSEMLARGSVGYLDVLIAFASGLMGAYATVRKDIPAALAGVAIAAALMPPLCTFGLGLASGNTALGLRAGLLFLTNIVFIVLAAWIVFLLVGMRPSADED